MLCCVEQKEGQTALHIAAYEGDESMVKLLVGTRANSNVLDKVRILVHSPLHNGHVQCD